MKCPRGCCKRRKKKDMESGQILRKNPLKSSLAPVLIFGKFIGVVPLSRKFRLSYILMPMFLVNLVMEICGIFTAPYKKKSPYDLAASVGGLLLYTLGLLIFRHMDKNYTKLETLMENWGESLNFDPPKRISFVAPIAILISAILENIIYQIKTCPANAEHRNFLDCSYHRMHVAWPHTFSVLNFYPHTEPLAVYLILTNKVVVYAWNFMDVLIYIISRELRKKFQVISDREESPETWNKLRDDYDKVMLKLVQVEQFLSPLIFLSYGMNTYAMCMQLKLWLTPSYNMSAIDSMYSIWSSLQLLIRVGLVSIAAARVNEAANDVLVLTRNCPDSEYSLDIYRLEVTVQSAHVGLTGMKCFFITKTFLLTLISVVFTFEIVLLQNFDEAPCPT